MASAPEVSVVIPTRNRLPLLETALRGALRQQDVDLEVVVVDDGSTDETASCLAARRDPRLRLLRHASARGVAAARNTGIAHARGEWIAFLDDDDVWSPRKLKTQLGAAAGAASFVYAAAVLLDEDGSVVETVLPPDPDELEQLLLERYVLPAGSSNVMARTDLVRRLGGFDERLSVLADWDFWIRLAGNAPGAACAEVLVGYVQHRGSMLLDERHDLIAEFEYLVLKHRAAHQALGVELDRLAFSRAVAWQHRRAGRRGQAAIAYFRGAWDCRSPGNVLRAFGALLGERATSLRRGQAVSFRPDWLDLYE
jgi:glycosyltransferase involved in cell wall biosynthesis